MYSYMLDQKSRTQIPEQGSSNLPGKTTFVKNVQPQLRIED